MVVKKEFKGEKNKGSSHKRSSEESEDTNSDTSGSESEETGSEEETTSGSGSGTASASSTTASSSSASATDLEQKISPKQTKTNNGNPDSGRKQQHDTPESSVDPSLSQLQTTQQQQQQQQNKLKTGRENGSSKTARSHAHAHHPARGPTKVNLSLKDAPKKARRRKRKPRALTICLTNCRYEIVRNVAKRYSLMEVGEDEAWNIYWTDFSVSLERAMDMRRYQLVNHFPGMNEICRKDLLARNLNRMKRLFCTDYDIFPKTWSLPADLGELQSYAHTRKNKTYICKPEMGCQGRGIFLIRSIKDLNPFGKIICQLYVARPFLIDNLKFDLRIYVLMTTCDPLRIYVYNEGLARFATAKYKPPTNSNTENSYMHLTNYAVNKYSRDFVVDDEGGSKRKLTAVYRWLEQRSYDTEELLNSIDDVIIKTLISAHPILKHNYRTCFPHHDLCSACFEILGFDILLDYKLKPYVLEVNHSPSFHTDAKLDKEIKESLLHDTFAMLNMKQLDIYKVESDDRKRIQDRLLNKHLEKKEKTDMIDGMSTADQQFQWELEHCGGYRLVYPSPTCDKYDKYFDQNLSSLYHETAASQARANCTKSQMEEYNKLKQQEERKRQALGQAAITERPKDKDKLRPESPSDPDKPKVKKRTLKKYRDSSCNFSPSPIVADEELDRMKSLMQRGMLIRSLGIELQVFKLLCQIGNLKPEEEKLFRRMHGFNNGGGGGAGATGAAAVTGIGVGAAHGLGAAGANPNQPRSKFTGPFQSVDPRSDFLEQFQKGEPTTNLYYKDNNSTLNLKSMTHLLRPEPNLPFGVNAMNVNNMQFNGANRGDHNNHNNQILHPAPNSSTVESPNRIYGEGGASSAGHGLSASRFEQHANKLGVGLGVESGLGGGASSLTTKNPYSVPYNSPAPFSINANSSNNPPAQQSRSRPKTSNFAFQQQQMQTYQAHAQTSRVSHQQQQQQQIQQGNHSQSVFIPHKQKPMTHHIVNIINSGTGATQTMATSINKISPSMGSLKTESNELGIVPGKEQSQNPSRMVGGVGVTSAMERRYQNSSSNDRAQDPTGNSTNQTQISPKILLHPQLYPPEITIGMGSNKLRRFGNNPNPSSVSAGAGIPGPGPGTGAAHSHQHPSTKAGGVAFQSQSPRVGLNTNGQPQQAQAQVQPLTRVGTSNLSTNSIFNEGRGETSPTRTNQVTNIHQSLLASSFRNNPWQPPPLAAQTGQYPNDPSKMRHSTAISSASKLIFRTSDWPPRGTTHFISPASGASGTKPVSMMNNTGGSNSGGTSGRKSKAGQPPPQHQAFQKLTQHKLAQAQDDTEPVQCTQMFFNNATFPLSPPLVAPSGGGDNHRQNANSNANNNTNKNVNFLRGVGNVALLRAGRLGLNSESPNPSSYVQSHSQSPSQHQKRSATAHADEMRDTPNLIIKGLQL